jgi:hypothetical protein
MIYIAPKVASYIQDLPSKQQEVLNNKINEAHDDPGRHAGTLVYNDAFIFEYKAGDRLRFFGLPYSDGDFVVFMVGDHTDDKYVGMAYDGKKSFDGKYDNKDRSIDVIKDQAKRLIHKAWPMNDSSSPSPVFD